mmetsp:Transcript_18818/g.23911  ORF Transcript_18818/g.23911 Transcript_18818/m.23911 type:complete len:372 (+) Transcript_18818:339-1454(+)
MLTRVIPFTMPADSLARHALGVTPTAALISMVGRTIVPSVVRWLRRTMMARTVPDMSPRISALQRLLGTNKKILSRLLLAIGLDAIQLFSHFFYDLTTCSAYHDGGFGAVSTWFDFAMNGCRVLPNVLLPMIRAYFPRDENGKAAYPPPFTSEGGPGLPDGMTYPYPLEFVNFVGETCKAEQGKFASAQCYEQHSNGNATDFPEYLQPGHGSPKYCSVGAKEADVNNDWCPYIFFGPNRGKYRHPHIAFAAVESWLASKVIDECGEEWDDNDGKDYPHTPDHSIAWPKMAVVEGFEDHPMQPALTEAGGFIWPGDEGTKRKACKGMFSIEKYLTPTTIGTPLVADSDEDSSSTAVSLSGAAMLVSAIMMMV